MTTKLYYEDQYIKEFSAEIINIIEKDGEFHIELDKTAFFPGGGGQPCDKGSIEDSIINSVYEKDGIIYHVSNKKPIKIHKSKCKIDWEFRFDGMQQHLGQHILSSAFLELFDANTVSFHLGKDFCTTDVDKFLSDEELEKVEELVNRNIFLARPVEFLTPSKSELKKLSLRRVPDIDFKETTLRVVKVDDIDTTACCGLHPRSTLEVQMLKIGRKEKAKGNMRVEFLCGKRAVDEALRKFRFSSKICKNLSCNEEEARKFVDARLVRKKNYYRDIYQYVMKKEKECPYISEDNLCGIYEKRPIICRLYICCDKSYRYNMLRELIGSTYLRALILEHRIRSNSFTERTIRKYKRNPVLFSSDYGITLNSIIRYAEEEGWIDEDERELLYEECKQL
jgi:Ser-tRNA(Ala) deacylase AlaX